MFHPKCDSYDLSYNEWVINLDWGNVGDIKLANKELIQNDLADFDFIIGLGYAPAFVNLINRKLDVMNPYGWDIHYAPHYKIVSPRYLKARQVGYAPKSRTFGLWIVHFNSEHGLYADLIGS